MRPFRWIIALLAALAAVLPAFAASNSADVAHLHVELVFPHRPALFRRQQRGRLYFKLEPGWHVYWQNAGDSGEPPRIQWTLPAGVTAGPISFPRLHGCRLAP